MAHPSAVRCVARVGEHLCNNPAVGLFAFSADDTAFPLCQAHFNWAKSCYDELDQIVAGVTS